MPQFEVEVSAQGVLEEIITADDGQTASEQVESALNVPEWVHLEIERVDEVSEE